MQNCDIEYKSLFMRCDKINNEYCIVIPENTEIKYYESGLENVWIKIQKSTGAFENHSNQDVYNYFDKTFLINLQELKRRCIFLKDKESNIYYGTCCAWLKGIKNRHIPILHWLAVDSNYQGKGYGKILVNETLKIFNKLNYGKSIYLHTQPSSYKAIKIYNDFGFCLTRTDSIGDAKNEYNDGIIILKKYLEKNTFNKLVNTSIN